jgi:hypothetical protein
MKNFTNIESGQQSSSITLSVQAFADLPNTQGEPDSSTNANAVREHGVGLNDYNIKQLHHIGIAHKDQLDAGENAIVVGSVPVLKELTELTPLTVSPSGLVETDKSAETDYSGVSNSDFMTAIIRRGDDGMHPFVCGFKGHPNSDSGAKWAGEDWQVGVTNTDDANKNWYFTPATFAPDSEGKYRRQKKQFVALHGIILDDVGTKACGLNRLDGLPLSWLIETSPGNYQAGYIFAEPMTDGAYAESLLNAVISAGLCDPGADGPKARYGRLPVAVNGKHDPAFPCRLVKWNPELRYTPEQIIDGLELVISETKAKGTRAKAVVRGTVVESDEDEVYSPRSEESQVITELKVNGLYKKPLGSGTHDITCPFVHEHTDEVDSGTAYFEPDAAHPVGGFKCMHGHCAGRNIRTLVDFLGISLRAAKHKATIRIQPGELKRIAESAECELAKTGHHFQRSGQIVTVETDPSLNETVINPLSQPGLLSALSDVSHWEKYDGRSKKVVPVDPSDKVVNILSKGRVYKNLPALIGLTRQPFLRHDGSLMVNAGYDKQTGMFGVFDERAFKVSENPTRAEAENALRTLTSLLDEFSFAADSDKAAALAAILTAAIRPSLPQAPMFHAKAPQIASGKSYLTALIARFATPATTPATSFPSNEDECQKLLLSALLTSPAVLCFDNLTNDLQPYKTLCSALTDEFVTGRILGFSKTGTVSTRTLFLSSGNNVDPIRDMSRRCITIRLDPACETPAARTFLHDPVGTVRNDRGMYVSLALTIMRAWIVAGCPKTACKPVASFGAWSDTVRQPLLWLGLPDPASSLFAAMDADPDREILGRLLMGCKRVFGSGPMMVRDIVEKASRLSHKPSEVELYEVISDIADERGQINRKRLGKWISRHAGRLVDGLKFEKAPAGRNAEQWKVVSVLTVISVSVSTPAKTVTVPTVPPTLLH